MWVVLSISRAFFSDLFLTLKSLYSGPRIVKSAKGRGCFNPARRQRMDELRLTSVVWAEFMSVDAISVDAISRGKAIWVEGNGSVHAWNRYIRLLFVKVLFLPVRILNRAGSFLLYRSRRAQNAILLSLFAPGSLPGP